MFLFILGFLVVIIVMGLFLLIGKYLAAYGFSLKDKKVGAIRLFMILVLGMLIRLWPVTGLIYVHLFVIDFLVAILYKIYGTIRRRGRHEKWGKQIEKIYKTGILTIVISGLYLGYGFYNMAHVIRTDYRISSDKITENTRILLIADTHYDAVQKRSVLKEKITEMNKLNADLLILAGDIVEEATSKEAMQEIFRDLGRIKSKYGIYYVYGNHDRQRYFDSMGRKRKYTEAELKNAIRENGIVILDDKSINIGREILLVGREDLSSEVRLGTKELLKNADKKRYIIMADHQPMGLIENSNEDVNLQVSGHTHAGQIFPTGLITMLRGRLNYGRHRIGSMDVIVTSGFAGWGFPFRTEKHSEYVVIDLTGE